MQSAISIKLHFVIWIALFVSSSTFLLSTECPAPSPCTCDGSSGDHITIECSYRGLSAVPQFGVFNASLKYYFIISLGNNIITTIQNNAFQNLSSIKTESITVIQLHDNRLNTMGTNAFAGVENVTELQLYNNNFTTIPIAIGSLKRLQKLSMYGNPLISLDHFVFSNIGNTLISFDFDVNLFIEWPGAELRLLTQLQTLTANKIPFSNLDANAFLGLGNTLNKLIITSDRLEKIPSAICQLTKLTTLYVVHISNLNENISSIFEPCGHTLRTVTSLYIYCNNLRIFPNVFSLFPSLTSVNLGCNRFEYIDSSKIPSDSRLQSIDLYNNNFERIPSALNKLKFLKEINLNVNKIKTLELFDLYSLSNLRSLSLGNNPLYYIAPGAFSRNLAIDDLSLEDTQLDYVPQEVTNLPNLRILNLYNLHIECTCKMSYLKHWNVSAVTSFHTRCASSTETIKSYIMTSLQSCP